MVKIRKPTNKGTTIQYLMAQGKSNAEISKILGVPGQRSLIIERGL